MARFVLVHGAWHGGWCWEEIVPRLEAAGHRVAAPDLPGMGADAASGHVATLDEWAMFIAGMAAADPEPAILVGHSRGGIVISRAAELAPPGSIARLVYLSALMVEPGKTMGETFFVPGETLSAERMAAVEVSGDGRTSRYVSRDVAIGFFLNTSPADRAEAAFARLSPEPTSMIAAPVVTTPGRYGQVPRSYIRCEQDRAVRPEVQARMVAAQPCEVHSLDCDHSPFYSAPDELAGLLDRIASAA